MPRSTRMVASIVFGALFAASCGSGATGTDLTATTNVSSAAPATTHTTPTTAAPTTADPIPDTTQPEPTEAEAIFTSYEFPAGLINDQPTLVQGLIGVPEGPGPFPVAIVMHGAHPPCVDDFIPEAFSNAIVTKPVEFLCGAEFPEYIRHDIGLGYIVQSLNDAGVAAVSIDVKAPYVWWGGEPFELGVLAALANTHYEALSRLNAGDDAGLDLDDSLDGRLNLEDVTLIGHSRSGGHLLSLLDADSGLLAFTPNAGILVQPDQAFVEGSVPDIPLLLIRGECDEDVGADSGLPELTALTSSNAQSSVGDLFVPSAGHRMLNTGLNGSTCPEQGNRDIISGQVAQGIASFVASSGERIEIVAGSSATFTSLGGPTTEELMVEPSRVLDPATVPFTSSSTRLLPALPEGADYSDALDEDF